MEDTVVYQANSKRTKNKKRVVLDFPHAIVEEIKITPIFPKYRIKTGLNGTVYFSTLIRKEIKGVWYVVLVRKHFNSEYFENFNGDDDHLIQHNLERFIEYAYYLSVGKVFIEYRNDEVYCVDKFQHVFKDPEQISEEERLNGFLYT